jgi:hypothetical protein
MGSDLPKLWSDKEGDDIALEGTGLVRMKT